MNREVNEMNLTLFKSSFKSNWLLFVIFLFVLLMYLLIMISMYDPKGSDALNDLYATLPEGLTKAMNLETFGTGLTAFIASYYYGFLIIVFPMIYCIILGNRLIAKHVDSGSMAFLLSTPNSRLKIVITQAIYMLLSITILLILVTVSGIGFSEIVFKGELDISAFLLLNLCAILTFWATSSICFFFSCLCNESKNSLAFGAGIPILFFLIKMLSSVSEKISWLKNFSLFSLFDAQGILEGEDFTFIACIILGIITIVFYVSSIFVFNKKDLPL